MENHCKWVITLVLNPFNWEVNQSLAYLLSVSENSPLVLDLKSTFIMPSAMMFF